MHHPLKTGHKTCYWCCQDKKWKSKSQPSKNEGMEHWDTLGMHQYDCKSRLNILCCTLQSKEGKHTITIYLEHHMKHTLYYDVSLPPEAAALIHKNIDFHGPNEIAKRILLTHPSVMANQVHVAWSKMSEALWKQDINQITSIKTLLGEYHDDVALDVAVLELPKMEGIEQVAWVMKKIVLPLWGKIVEIGIDATCE